MTREVPASAEIVLKVTLNRRAYRRAVRRPTGYYNEVDNFPVFTVTTLPSVKMPFITPPIPAVHPTNRRYWAWR